MLLGRLKYKCGPDLMCNKLEKEKKKKFRKGVSMLLKSLNKYTVVTEEGFFNKENFYRPGLTACARLDTLALLLEFL